MRRPLKNRIGFTDGLKTNEKKWSKILMEAGWTAIPSIVIEKQASLGLNPIDMNIIMHLSHYWWSADKLPHPSVKTIADALGLKPRTIQKHIAALEAAGFITRIERRTKMGSDTNLYSFEGLINAAQPFAEEKVREIKENSEAKRERIERKRPKLVINNA